MALVICLVMCYRGRHATSSPGDAGPACRSANRARARVPCAGPPKEWKSRQLRSPEARRPPGPSDPVGARCRVGVAAELLCPVPVLLTGHHDGRHSSLRCGSAPYRADVEIIIDDQDVFRFDLVEAGQGAIDRPLSFIHVRGCARMTRRPSIRPWAVFALCSVREKPRPWHWPRLRWRGTRCCDDCPRSVARDSQGRQ